MFCPAASRAAVRAGTFHQSSPRAEAQVGRARETPVSRGTRAAAHRAERTRLFMTAILGVESPCKVKAGPIRPSVAREAGYFEEGGQRERLSSHSSPSIPTSLNRGGEEGFRGEHIKKQR